MSIPSVETKVEMAVRERVEALPMAATYPIVWSSGPGTYQPSPAQSYLRCTWTPNRTGARLIGSEDPVRRPGLLQIDVMDTLTRGAITARETAGKVAAHFRQDLVMTFMGVKVQVTREPSAYGAFIGTHVQIPIEIELEAYE